MPKRVLIILVVLLVLGASLFGVFNMERKAENNLIRIEAETLDRLPDYIHFFNLE